MIEKVYDDNTLSFKEKGLYTAIYLNETMNVDQLVESGKDKADAVRSGLKKLIEKQYIKKSVVREKNGNFFVFLIGKNGGEGISFGLFHNTYLQKHRICQEGARSPEPET